MFYKYILQQNFSTNRIIMRTTSDLSRKTFERCTGALSREAGGQAAADTQRGPGKDQGAS